MKNIFTRSLRNPILQTEGTPWIKIYNPAACLDSKGAVHLFPRVVAERREDDWHSRIGHASSKDGEQFIWSEPVLTRSEKEEEKRGFEDPRVTFIEGIYYMTFAIYDGSHVHLHSATARSLNGPWERQGPMVPEFDFFQSGGKVVRFEEGKPVEKSETKRGTHWSKSGGLFPEKINNMYLVLFGEFYLWLASSKDGIHFDVQQPFILAPRKGTDFFDNAFVEMGPPPVRTEKGWLVLYHGVNEEFRYQIGFLLLDLGDPSKILYRSTEPIFGPQEEYEMRHEHIDTKGGGLRVQVVFCCGAFLKDEELWIYYGTGDELVCTAHAPLKSILDLAA